MNEVAAWCWFVIAALGGYTIGMLTAALVLSPARYYKKGYEVACRDLLGEDYDKETKETEEKSPQD